MRPASRATVVDPKDRDVTTAVEQSDSLARRLAVLGKNEINTRDLFGRTALHLLASAGHVPLLTEILDSNAHVDLALSDHENGWTALHRALFAGNVHAAQLLIARNRELLKVKDRSRLTPWQLLHSTVNSRFGTWPRPDASEATDCVGTQLFTFGSNANNVLGFADSDDRASPALVKLQRLDAPTDASPRQRLRPVAIRDVYLSKLHSVVLTSDRTDNMLVCGVARGGRLGLGLAPKTKTSSANATTQFTYTRVPAFAHEQIVAVALGLDHTLAVTTQGSLYACGSNRFGQLGLAGVSTDSEQLAPKKVVGSAELKRTHLIGCSASRLHSVAFSADQLFCWGTNVGQLGYTSTIDAAVGSVMVTAASGGILEPVPKRVPLQHSEPIRAVCATDIATVVLVGEADVFVYMNGGFFKVPLPAFDSLSSSSFDAYRPRSAARPLTVRKLAASNNGTVCVLVDSGEVFVFALGRHYQSPALRLSGTVVPTKPSQIAKALKVNLVWAGRTTEMLAIDADVADDGSVVLCTRSGSVWKQSLGRKGTRSGGYKFDSVPLVNRVQKVHCDALFRSFALVRDEVAMDPIEVSTHSLGSDLHHLAPFVEFAPLIDRHEHVRPFSYISRDATPDQTDDEVADQEHDGMVAQVRSSLQVVTPEALKYLVDRTANDQRVYDFDIVVDEAVIPVHRAVFHSRIPALLSMSGVRKVTPGGGSLEVTATRLRFSSVSLEAVLALVYYVYTDSVMAVSSDKRHDSRQQLVDLAKVLELNSLRSALLRLIRPEPTLGADLLGLINHPSADVEVKLAQGETLKCHRCILEARSSLFATLLSNRWDNGAGSIDLSDVPLDVFEIVVRHLYGDLQATLFDQYRVGEDLTTKQFMQFVLEVLVVADELLLVKLKQICQSVILTFVSVKNCAWILAMALDYGADQLQNRVVNYICHNLDCILENGFLADLDATAFDKIDGAMKRLRQTHDNGRYLADLDRFLTDLDWHNELLTRVVPVQGAGGPSALARKSRKESSSRRGSGTADSRAAVQAMLAKERPAHDHDGVFELEMDDEMALAHIKRKSSAQLLLQRRGSSSSLADTGAGSPLAERRASLYAATPEQRRPSLQFNVISSSPIVGSPMTASSPSMTRPSTATGTSPLPLAASWGSPSRMAVQPAAQAQVWPTLGQETLPGAPVLPVTPVRPVSKLSAQLKGSTSAGSSAGTSASVSASTSASASATTSGRQSPMPTHHKLSQKERKKLQREGQVNQSPSLDGTGPAGPSPGPWASSKSNYVAASPAAKPWGTPSRPPTVAVFEEPSSSKPRIMASSVPAAKPTLSEIMLLEEKAQKLKSQKQAKPMHVIQAEEEFERWWAQESERVQAQNQEMIKAEPKSGNSNGNGNGNGNSSGSGKGRGRGRGNRRAQSAV